MNSFTYDKHRDTLINKSLITNTRSISKNWFTSEKLGHSYK
jgi:hypothetical protein